MLEDSIEQVSLSIDRDLKKMDEYLSAGNLTEFAILAHGMKGALSNIGAGDNSVLAAELEIAAKAGDMHLCIEKYTSYASIMESFSHELRQLFYKNGTDAQPQGDINTLKETLDRVIKNLEAFEADDALAELVPISGFLYAEEINSALDSAVALVKSFRYSEAAAELRRIYN